MYVRTVFRSKYSQVSMKVLTAPSSLISWHSFSVIVCDFSCQGNLLRNRLQHSVPLSKTSKFYIQRVQPTIACRFAVPTCLVTLQEYLMMMTRVCYDGVVLSTYGGIIERFFLYILFETL